MPIVLLEDRALISVAGPDAEHFLQNIITTDLDKLPVGEARAGALLTPQGKILFDFLVSRDGDARFLLDCRKETASDFVRRLMLYRLRAKAEIAIESERLVAAAWDADSSPSDHDSTQQVLVDQRFPAVAGARRIYSNHINSNAPRAAWDRLRIRFGIAESGPDYALGDAFPHDVLLDQIEGVGFRKGCYIGQEVVSRMQHRGTARRRVLIAEGATALPPSGTDIMAGGKSIGVMGAVEGEAGLAIARIDKVKAAMDAGEAMTAGETVLTLSIPSWAQFQFPQAQDEDA